MQAGEDVADCLATYLLSMREGEDLDDLDITFICCAFMIGGVESVSRYKILSQASLTLAFVRALPSYSGSSRLFLRTLQSKNAPTMSSTVWSVAIAYQCRKTRRICRTSVLLSRSCSLLPTHEACAYESCLITGGWAYAQPILARNSPHEYGGLQLSRHAHPEEYNRHPEYRTYIAGLL